MFLAAEAVKATTKTFDVFDIFVLIFTLIIAIGVIRSVAAPQKNKIAIGFGLVSLLVFLFMDMIMVKTWFGM
jgi:hypothetical protein